MFTSSRAINIVRFEGLEVDLHAGELRRDGEKIKLQEQPLQILRMLLERPGEIVTREEIRQKLWPTDTFVEFDHSINAAIQRLRQALGDSAEHPRYVETLARRGYRFIAPLDVGAGLAPAQVGRPQGAPLQTRWLVALSVGTLAAVVVTVLALNLAGLRDRVFPPPPPRIESIAVLPLENLSGDPEEEYFADGMTDALISNLGKIAALRVISRTSVMQYKKTKKPLPEIARELNVDAVVEGSVFRSGDRVRVATQLMQANPEKHLWAETYERDLRNILALQSEVAQAIAREIQVKLTPQEQTRLAAARPVNPEAHELYLKGNYYLNREDPNKAIECFEQASRKDAQFARAYLGLAQSYIALALGTLVPSAEAAAKYKEAARKAVELDESLAEAHAALASALFWADWDWGGAEREYRRALELNPNSDGTHRLYTWYLTLTGRAEEALAHARRAQEINPLAQGNYQRLGWVHYRNRQYDQALEQFQRELDSSGPTGALHMYLGWTYREKGMYKQAIGELLQEPDSARKYGHLGYTYARAGQKAEAQRYLQNLIELSSQKIGAWEVALVYAGLGDKDRAFEWLERAYRAREFAMLYLKVAAPLDPLRSDPRFQDLLRRMNFPP